MSTHEVATGGLLGPIPLAEVDEVLYHYCSTSTFQQIISNGTIWLSALTLSNDSLEGKLVSAVIKRLAESDKIDAQKISSLLTRVDFLEELFEGLGLCLSKEGDLLSQWRGYADDANGFSIGFSAKYLDWLGSFNFFQHRAGFQRFNVLYEEDEHERKLRPPFEEMKASLSAAGLNQLNKLAELLRGPKSDEDIAKEKAAEDRLSQLILSLVDKWFLLKTNAFREEREVGLLSYLVHVHDREDVKYRATRNSIIAYREFSLLEKERMPISRVILGPKQKTPLREVEHFLRISGFENVKVERSKATYR